MLAEIEAAIVQKLSATLASNGIRPQAFPENPRELGQPMPRGQILVGYKRSNFNLQSRQPITLQMNAEFEVSLQVTNLRTHSGAYPLLDAIRFALLGFIPMAGPSAGMYPINEGFTDLDEGVWYYSQTYLVPLTLIEGQIALYDPLPPDTPWEFVGIECGIWRSRTGRLGEPDHTILDRTFELDAP